MNQNQQMRMTQKDDRARNPKTAPHTSDDKKIKFTDTSNRDLQYKLFRNRTLLIITITMYPNIDDNIATCSGNPHTIATPLTKKFIIDAACSSARVLRTPRHVNRTDRDCTNPVNTPHDLRSPQDNSPGQIGGIGVSPASVKSWSLQVFNRQQSTISGKIGDTKNWTLLLIESCPNYQDSMSIF